jgi:plastocyanin
MNKKHYLFVLGIAVIVIILVGAIFLLKLQGKPKSLSSMKQEISKIKEVDITLGKNGFSPDAITIKIGTPVRWINISGKPQTVNSDNYPTNQLHRQLNFGIFNSGSSVTYTFKSPGVYGYHNQLNHTQEGKVIVVQ